MNFAYRLAELRKKLNMTQKELAVAINVAPSTIGMWETNKRDPNSDDIINIASFFDVTTDYLLGRSSRPEFTKRDEIDVAEMMENMEKEIMDGSLRLSLDGEEIDEEIRNHLIQTYKDAVVIARLKNIEKKKKKNK